jgi:hypothetical protein
MVTYTCAYGPVGPAQVAGSLNITVAEPVDVVVAGGEEDPLLHATANAPARSTLDADATTWKNRNDLDLAATEYLLE